MKKFLFVFAASTLFACGQSGQPQQSAQTDSTAQATYYGEKISEDSAISIDELANLMGTDSVLNIKLTAEVGAVCQKKGCWMDLKKADGSTMRVTFKDYGFFMPKDGAGKTAVVRGFAKVEETSVADLQEYAKDAGKSKEEIAAITKPERELVFEADGVILK